MRDAAECPNDSAARVLVPTTLVVGLFWLWCWLDCSLVVWLVGLFGSLWLFFLVLVGCCFCRCWFVYINFAGNFNSTWLFASYLFGLYCTCSWRFHFQLDCWFKKMTCVFGLLKWITSQPTTMDNINFLHSAWNRNSLRFYQIFSTILSSHHHRHECHRVPIPLTRDGTPEV